MDNILITGHRGMIGSRLFKRIDAFGIDIREGYNLITADLPKVVDVIYHLAAQSSVEASWHDPVHDMDNIRMTARLVKEYPKAKIIYAASAASPSTSPYGFSKWASAQYIKNFHKNYVICTLPNVYGERGGKSVVDIFKGKKEVIIYGDGEQKRSYVHVNDIADALVLAKDWEIGEYQLGNGVATSVLDLVQKEQDKTFLLARQEARESVLKNTTPNWAPKINVIDYLHDTI